MLEYRIKFDEIHYDIQETLITYKKNTLTIRLYLLKIICSLLVLNFIKIILCLEVSYVLFENI